FIPRIERKLQFSCELKQLVWISFMARFFDNFLPGSIRACDSGCHVNRLLRGGLFNAESTRICPLVIRQHAPNGCCWPQWAAGDGADRMFQLSLSLALGAFRFRIAQRQ